ncbi:helix-turn-helix transcriptional regulator [bacterium]|nr:helix-turn-helix transcriptional regulator [bacterium]
MNNKLLLGKRIKEIRKMSNLTQEQLAELVDIETSSLSGIESGRHFPSLPTLEKIADKLGVEIKSLFDFEHHQSIDKMKKIIFENIDNLDDDKILFIYKFIETFKK